MGSEENRTVEFRLRAAVESSPSGILMADSQGKIVLVNREVERLFGYPREELLGKSVDLLVPEALRTGHEEFRAEFLKDPKVRAMGAGRDLYGRRKDGSQVPVEIGLTPVATEEGMFVLSSIVDISSRRRAEARFRAAVESSPAGIVMVDADGKIVLVNQEVERMFGYGREELIGRSIEELVPERFRDAHPRFRRGFFQAPDARPMGAGRDLYGLRKDGTEIPVEIGLNRIETEDGLFVLSSIVDITARKEEEAQRERLERKLRQTQKMEAVGTLAGGIAHDFSNILGAILGFGELLRESVTGKQAQRDLEELIRFTERGKSLVEKIQAFGRPRESEMRPLSLSDPLADVESFLRSSLPPNIEIVTTMHPEAPRVFADASAIHQVLMNLGMNAAHAMPEGGRLKLTAEPLYLTDSRAREHPTLRADHYALVSAEDTGTGMEPDVQSRAFEPFFTTKEPGQGSGLGLAIVHGIMRDHRGAVELDSTPGEGTTVRLIIPAAEQDGPEEAPATTSAPRGSGERILYVDDEPGLAAVGKRRLERLGYQVVIAHNGEQALELFRSAPDEFDAVISDYLMPRLNGLEVATEVLSARPDLAFVMLTGFIDDLPTEAISAAGVAEVVRKPVTSVELATTLARVFGKEAED